MNLHSGEHTLVHNPLPKKASKLHRKIAIIFQDISYTRKVFPSQLGEGCLPLIADVGSTWILVHRT